MLKDMRYDVIAIFDHMFIMTNGVKEFLANPKPFQLRIYEEEVDMKQYCETLKCTTEGHQHITYKNTKQIVQSIINTNYHIVQIYQCILVAKKN